MTGDDTSEDNEPDPAEPDHARHAPAGEQHRDLTLAEAAAMSELSALATVASAENAVRIARIDDLTERQAAAHRRILDARDQLTRAKTSGDPEQIAAARDQLRTRLAEADESAQETVSEIEQLVEAHVDQHHDHADKIRSILETQDGRDAGSASGDASDHTDDTTDDGQGS